MREYALQQAQVFDAFPGSGLLGTLFRNWRARAGVAQMAELSDSLLADIGLTREDIRAAATMPLTRNAALELSEGSRRR